MPRLAQRPNSVGLSGSLPGPSPHGCKTASLLQALPPHGTSIEVANGAAGWGEGLREQVIFPGTPGQCLLSSYLSSYMPSP